MFYEKPANSNVPYLELSLKKKNAGLLQVILEPMEGEKIKYRYFRQ